MRIDRVYTTSVSDPYDLIEWTRTDSEIRNPDGGVVFSLRDIEVPKGWSKVAADVLAQKYFRKAGVPAITRRVPEDGVPNWLQRSVGVEVAAVGSETSAKQVFDRLAGAWTYWGWKMGVFDPSADQLAGVVVDPRAIAFSNARAYFDEMRYMLAAQIAAPNSPQWFNTGLHWAYGIDGPSQGHYYYDTVVGEVVESKSSYERPQPHACFIQSVADDLVNDGGIMDLWTREARLFKYGSGCLSGDADVVTATGIVNLRSLWRRARKEGLTPQEFDGAGRYIDVAHWGVKVASLCTRTGSYRFAPLDKVWSYRVPKEDKVCVTFDTGAKVTTSAWHPFMKWNGEAIVECRADTLVRGDAVAGPNTSLLDTLPKKNHSIDVTSRYFGSRETQTIAVDADVAWLIGYFFGNGNLGKTGKSLRYGTTRYRVRFSDHHREPLDKIVGIIDSLFGEKGTVKKSKRADMYGVSFTGRWTTRLFRTLSRAGSKTYTMKVPNFVYFLHDDVYAAFIAGLADSDGSVSGGRIHYHTASPKFLSALAGICSVRGHGGSSTRRSVCLVRRSYNGPLREAIVANMATPRHVEAMRTPSRRQWTLPLTGAMREAIIDQQEDYLHNSVDGELIHTGRLRYDSVVNSCKVSALATLLRPKDSALLQNVASGAAFVTDVASLDSDVDFYDLTVGGDNNYLAGENGFVTVHNTGTNFSAVRGENEKLSGGGKSSGLMSFLKIGDASAGAIKSGGTTRRAAKMVVLDVDHPDVVEFVQWKSREEDKVAALVTGSKVVKKHVRSIMRACINCEGEGDSCFDPKKNPALHKEIRLARRASVPDSYIHRTVQLARQGISEIDFDEFSLDWGSEAYTTVSGQNSNNSVRVSDAFMEAVNLDTEWKLKARLTGETMRVVSSRDLWDKIGYAAWSSADPGVQYDTTINDWHTCSVDGRINASNPCCFVAGTFVDTSEGLIDIAELTRMKRRGETLPLAFSYDFDKGGPVLRQINNAWKAGVTRNLVEVRTEKGQRIRCTPEHVWYLRDGTEVQAKDLQPGMSLRKIKRGANPHRSGRISILSFPDSRSERGRCSQARWMWKQVFGDIPEGFEVHHRNEDPTDDRISNFKLVEGRRHRRFHARGLRNPRAIDVSSEVLVEVFDTIASQDRKTHKRRDGVSPAMWNSYIRRNNLRGKVPMAASPTLGGRIRGMKWDAFVSQMEEARYDVNDRVKRVKNIVLDSAVPVYDIEVEGTHNFGIRDDQDGSKSSLIVSNSEYMFLDDTACNLASLNLKKFGGVADFDVDRFRHAVRLWTITLEISVEMAQFPSREIALRSYKYRTLGLGYANVGGMLMSSGVGYDSRTGRATIGAITAIMTGEAYATSARMAEQLGPFVRYEANKDSMERVIRNHRAAAQGTFYSKLSIEPPKLDHYACSPVLAKAARDVWDDAINLGTAHGYRNAQVSCIAPTGCTLSTTRIRTEDGIKSYREILEENDIDWKEIEKGNDQRWIPLKPFWLPSQDGHRDYADKIWYNGIQETYVVTFEDGTEFECTGNHKLLVRLSNSETAWIEAQYLNGDEEVLSS